MTCCVTCVDAVSGQACSQLLRHGSYASSRQAVLACRQHAHHKFKQPASSGGQGCGQSLTRFFQKEETPARKSSKRKVTLKSLNDGGGWQRRGNAQYLAEPAAKKHGRMRTTATFVFVLDTYQIRLRCYCLTGYMMMMKLRLSLDDTLSHMQLVGLVAAHQVQRHLHALSVHSASDVCSVRVLADEVATRSTCKGS
jgi:hypothetical protein